jgi:Tfp pilus assembly protein PilF
MALLGRGMKAEARAALERAVAIDPENARAWVVLSERRRTDGDFPGADEAVKQARLSRDIEVRGDAEIMAGLLALAKQDPTSALARFGEAQRLVPSNARAYLYEAQIHAQAGDANATIAVLRRGLAAAPGSPELASALVKMGQVP